ncbi:hypothetical protein ABTM73_19155, partial [Acinetobacter baumannii]
AGPIGASISAKTTSKSLLPGNLTGNSVVGAISHPKLGKIGGGGVVGGAIFDTSKSQAHVASFNPVKAVDNFFNYVRNTAKD